MNAYHLQHRGVILYKDLNEFLSSNPGFGKLQPHFDVGLKLYNDVVSRNSGSLAPVKFDAGPNFASFLYAYVMVFKPRVIIETGVASGITTNCIMKALENIGCGELHSFDVNPDSENAYQGTGNWNFHILRKNYTRHLYSEIRAIRNIDLWIHDSDHSLKWQRMEYYLAKKHLVESGLLVSDDIDTTIAWAKSLKEKNSASAGIFDTRKFFSFLFPNSPELNQKIINRPV